MVVEGQMLVETVTVVGSSPEGVVTNTVSLTQGSEVVGVCVVFGMDEEGSEQVEIVDVRVSGSPPKGVDTIVVTVTQGSVAVV